MGTSRPVDEFQTIRDAQQAAGRLADTERTLRARYRDLVKERDRVKHALRHQDEINANIDTLVDAAARKFDDELGWPIIDALSGHERPSRSPGSEKVFAVAPALPFSGPEGARQVDFARLCALAPELMKDRLKRLVREYKKMPFGLPVADRQRRLAEFDAQIADVARQHAALVDGAADVGITLEHLPATQEARAEAAAAQQRDQELAAERQRVEEELQREAEDQRRVRRTVVRG